MVELPDCIEIRWDVRFGEACLRGTRIPIWLIRSFGSVDEFCGDYRLEEREAEVIAIRSLTLGQRIVIGKREAKEMEKANEYWAEKNEEKGGE